jgi:glycine/D-amino acid oxidase-like deaminating enzyme
MSHRHRTVIVGAGISGLACARTLFDAGDEFVVISPGMGGRVLQSEDGALPLGAMYVRADYEHVTRFVNRGRRFRSHRTLRHDESGAYSGWDRRLFAHPLQVMRFLVLLRRFQHHYSAFRANSLAMSQADALAADGFLHRLYHQPATATVQENRFLDIARAYVEPGLRGTTFLPLDRLTGFTMLTGSLPAVSPTYEFTMRWDELMAGFAGNIIDGTVDEVVDAGCGYRVRATDGRIWYADNVVIATHPSDAQKLVAVRPLKEAVSVHMFEIDGRLRADWTRADLHLFARDQPDLAILQRPGRPVLLCSHQRYPDLRRYFTHSTVLEHHCWDPAFNISGDELVECELATNLYLIGDHNICGLEDAFITGVYAANRIIASAMTFAAT